jgi:hypothetical protein
MTAVLEILIDTDEFVHAMPFRAGAWNEPIPLMRHLRIEGLVCDA